MLQHSAFLGVVWAVWGEGVNYVVRFFCQQNAEIYIKSLVGFFFITRISLQELCSKNKQEGGGF